MSDGGEARPTYHRVLLKLSGEAFAHDSGSGISDGATALVARQLAEVVDLGIQTAVVVGGGNIWRGRQAPGIPGALVIPIAPIPFDGPSAVWHPASGWHLEQRGDPLRVWSTVTRASRPQITVRSVALSVATERYKCLSLQ